MNLTKDKCNWVQHNYQACKQPDINAENEEQNWREKLYSQTNERLLNKACAHINCNCTEWQTYKRENRRMVVTSTLCQTCTSAHKGIIKCQIKIWWGTKLNFEASAVTATSGLLKLSTLGACVRLSITVWHTWCPPKVLHCLPSILGPPQQNLHHC